MYSRYHDSQAKPIQIPDNYGGCAFSSASAPPVRHFTPPSDLRHPGIAKPTLPPPKDTPSGSCAPPVQEAPEPHEEQAVSAAPKSPLALGGFPFAHGLGFEELLILGLIVLLLHSEQGVDTVLWLALLLFCG